MLQQRNYHVLKKKTVLLHEVPASRCQKTPSREAAGKAMSHWTETQQARLCELIDSGATLAYWCSDQFGQASNGGTKDFRVSPGLVQTLERKATQLCDAGALHATLQPHRWRGCRVWIVALSGDVQHESDKLGAVLTRSDRRGVAGRGC
jgi:hypothetical protein